MTNYLITLGFWLACAAVFLLYWRLRLNRQEREAQARHEGNMAEMRARWNVEDAKDRTEHEALVAELDAKADRVNQYLIARGLEPVPREPPEPTEPPEPQA